MIVWLDKKSPNFITFNYYNYQYDYLFLISKNNCHFVIVFFLYYTHRSRVFHLKSK